MEEEGGRAAASSYSCPCDAIFQALEFGEGELWDSPRCISTSMGGGAPCLCLGCPQLWNSSSKTKANKAICCVSAEGFLKGIRKWKWIQKATPQKKKSKLYLCISMYISIEGTLQEHCAVLISKSLPACVSYTFCIAVLFVLGEKIRLHLVKLK